MTNKKNNELTSFYLFHEKKHCRHGFTLLELLIVIAIIGILATAILVGINAARTKAKRSSALQTLSSIMPELEVCEIDGGSVSNLVPVVGNPICCATSGGCPLGAQPGHTETWPSLPPGTTYDRTPGTKLQNRNYTYFAKNPSFPDVVCFFATQKCQ